jgi:hypothetical protein
MVVSDELTLRLLSVRRTWTDPDRLNTAVTALLLLDQDRAHFDAALKGVRTGRYRVDSKLMADLYAVLPKRLRVELLASTAGRRLDPKTFRALFFPLFRDRALTPKQRRRLVQWSFGANIGPKNAEENRDLILEMLRSKDTQLVLTALLTVEYLNYVPREDLDIIKRKTQSRDNLRYAGCAALTALARRHKEVHPSVLEYCLQPSISRIAHRIYRKDREAPGRLAGFFLLEALHRAGGPIAPGVRPRWAVYDKRFGRPRPSKRRTSKR